MVCGRRAAGGWGDDDGDNEVDDRSCDEVHCYSGAKFLQFLVENLLWEVTVHIVWYYRISRGISNT